VGNELFLSAAQTSASSIFRPESGRSVVFFHASMVLNKVSGHPGTHRFGAGQLIRFVPLNKVKLAAKRILGSSSAGRRLRGVSRRRRGRRGGRRRRRKTKKRSKRKKVAGGSRRRRRRRVRKA